VPLITDGTAVLVYIILLIGALYRISEMKACAPFFRYLPPVIWVYFLPMISSNLGIIPQNHDLYLWIRTYLLPTALVLMLLSANVPALAKLGGKAVLTVFAGSLGIAVGAIVSYSLLQFWLPEEAWKGIGALTGSWIGGSANMVAVATSVDAPEAMLGPIIVVDTIVGYGWMGIVIALAIFQDRIDERNKVDRTIVEQLNKRMKDLYDTNRRPLRFIDLITMLAVGFGVGYAMVRLGEYLPDIGAVLTSFGWAIILSSLIGIVLSLTRLSDLEYAGASSVGNFFFYLILATIGARADLAGILDAPVFLLAGIFIITVHALILFSIGKLLRSPMFLIATASQSNIGGPITAPIVATVYQGSLAPVGLLMAVVCGVTGTFVALMVAQIMYWISIL
jgi:uncharacterized membrane protein